MLVSAIALLFKGVRTLLPVSPIQPSESCIANTDFLVAPAGIAAGFSDGLDGLAFFLE